MSDIDFADLRLAAEEAAHQPDFAAIEARAGVARRTASRRRAVLSGAAAFAGVLTVTGIVVSTLPPAEPTPPEVASAPPVAAVTSVSWAGAGDAQHLYALSDRTDLYASDDGGATWQPRTLPEQEGSEAWMSLQVYGPRVLVAPPTGRSRPYLSVDGGRTWRADAMGAQPISAGAADGLSTCSTSTDSWRCSVHGYRDGRVAPLAVQPPIDAVAVAPAPATAGLWITGYEPGTLRPALAVSRDGGATWQRHVFSAESAPPGDRVGATFVPSGWAPNVVTVDGRTVHAVLHSAQTVDGAERDAFTVYDSADGGSTWTERPDVGGMTTPFAFATNDGDLVTMKASARGMLPLRSRNGGPFRPVAVSGLDHFDFPPTPIGSGRFLATTTDAGVLISEDGFTWRRSLPE